MAEREKMARIFYAMWEWLSFKWTGDGIDTSSQRVRKRMIIPGGRVLMRENETKQNNKTQHLDLYELILTFGSEFTSHFAMP